MISRKLNLLLNTYPASQNPYVCGLHPAHTTNMWNYVRHTDLFVRSYWDQVSYQHIITKNSSSIQQYSNHIDVQIQNPMQMDFLAIVVVVSWIIIIHQHAFFLWVPSRSSRFVTILWHQTNCTHPCISNDTTKQCTCRVLFSLMSSHYTITKH